MLSETENNKVLYNAEHKEKFLRKYPKSASNYERVFIKSASIEEKHNKDLANFGIPEIVEVLTELHPSTSDMSHVNGRIISSYIKWAIENKLRTASDKNPLKAADAEWFEKFVEKEKEDLYFTERTLLIAIEGRCKNAQDAVLFRLLFEGVNGKQASEIRNLKTTDVEEAVKKGVNSIGLYELMVTDEDGSTRAVPVSKRCIDLLQRAVEEKTYHKSNGKMIQTENVREFTDLVHNDYVVRSSDTRAYSLASPVHKSVIYRRVNAIQKDIGMENLTTKNVSRSGMIFYAKKLYEAEGELQKEQYMRICEKFNVNHWFPLKGFCNVEMIEALYGSK